MNAEQQSIQTRIAELEQELHTLRFQQEVNTGSSALNRPSSDTFLVKDERLAYALDVGGGIGMWDWDIDTDRVYCDPRFAEFFALDPQLGLRGAPLSEFVGAIHEDDRSRVSQTIHQAVHAGGDYAAEFRIVHRDASVHWVYARGHCHKGANGKASHFPGVVFDITERKQAEMMLAEKARLAALGVEVGAAMAEIAALPETLQRCVQSVVNHLDAAFARIWTLNALENMLELQASAGMYTHLNGPHARVPVGSFKIGLIAKERQPHLTNDVLHDPRVADNAWAAREGMLSFAGYPLIVEGRLVGVLALFARHALGQDTIRALASVSTTIAIGIERKRAEASLRESEERYRFLAEAMPQIVWTAKPDGGLDYVSDQGAIYFGLKSEALFGTGWMSGVHPDDQPKAAARWQHSLLSREPYEVEFRLRRAEDGAWRWFLARAHSMLAGSATSGNNVICWVGTCTDIHEQKQSEQALTKANRELEEFAYVASHDLQEPLRMVNVYTQLILKRLGTQDAVLNQFAEFVHQGVHRMDALLRDLLSFSRSVHTEKLAFGTADLSEAFDDAVSVLKSRIEETGAVIHTNSLPETRGETRQMSHVFQNLLSNSLKYRQAAPPEIIISAEKVGDSWTVALRDNGIGFDPRYAEQIFGLFKRLHKDEYPGTGLGLAICQRIVERYGGRMWAESEPGQGSVFRFSLPSVEA